MALAYIPVEVEIGFIDIEGTHAHTRFFLPPLGTGATNADDNIAKAIEVMNAIAALSDCALLSRSIIFQSRDNAVVGAGEVERKGLFTFAPAQGTEFTTMVPGFKDSLLDADKRSISVVTGGPQTKAEVTAFVNAVLNGSASLNNGATNAAGISLSQAISGKKYHEGSLKEKRGKSG